MSIKYATEIYNDKGVNKISFKIGDLFLCLIDMHLNKNDIHEYYVSSYRSDINKLDGYEINEVELYMIKCMLIFPSLNETTDFLWAYFTNNNCLYNKHYLNLIARRDDIARDMKRRNERWGFHELNIQFLN
jgi:hypothetical protein